MAQLREKRPGPDWREIPIVTPARAAAVNGASSTWVRGPIRVVSSLIDTELPGDSTRRGPQWLVSVTTNGGRPKHAHVKKALRAFGMRGAEEDNHHPGDARHFFMVVAPADRVDCECKTDEAVKVDADGYRWSQKKDGPCAGCELESVTGRPCAEHHAGGQVMKLCPIRKDDVKERCGCVRGNRFVMVEHCGGHAHWDMEPPRPSNELAELQERLRAHEECLEGIREALRGVQATEAGGISGDPYVDGIRVLREGLAASEATIVRLSEAGNALADAVSNAGCRNVGHIAAPLRRWQTVADAAGALRQPALSEVWVVRHIPSDTWWRPKRSGYTAELLAAGAYTESEAKSCERTRSPREDGSREDLAMSLADAIRGLETETVGALVGLPAATRESLRTCMPSYYTSSRHHAMSMRRDTDAGDSIPVAAVAQETSGGREGPPFCPRCKSPEVDNLGDGERLVCLACDACWAPAGESPAAPRIVSGVVSPETRRLLDRAVQAQKDDARTPAKLVADGVAFVMGEPPPGRTLKHRFGMDGECIGCGVAQCSAAALEPCPPDGPYGPAAEPPGPRVAEHVCDFCKDGDSTTCEHRGKAGWTEGEDEP